MAGSGLKLCAVYGKMFLLLLFIDRNRVEAKNDQQDLGECQQHPRFLAARKGVTVHFYCSCGTLCAPRHIQQVSWYKGTENGTLLQPLIEDHNLREKMFQSNNSSTITLHRIQYSDNGIYYCRFETDNGPQTPFCGTELKVLGFGTVDNIKTKNTLKDAIIMIQSILIVVFIAVPMLLVIDKSNKPVQIDEDHTYEGLQIEETATYEDIIAYRVGDAKWTAGEHPCQE
ncbi:B-cell antigen receptor complex-associated protein beta chain-like [Lissotriton helveticus]